MIASKCTISFFKNDLQRAKLYKGLCPVKNCSAQLSKIPFHKYKIPFCPEHGIRIHKNTFVYYNGDSDEAKILATRRNLMFRSDYYIDNFFKKGSKAESGRLCYENSEDAVSYNIFTELLAKNRLKELAKVITNKDIDGEIKLYLWGGEIGLKNNKFSLYKPLLEIRERLESDIRNYKTEPDIMLIVPKKLIICIEAKFSSKNPITKDKEAKPGEKPKRKEELIKRYCTKNKIINTDKIFDLNSLFQSSSLFYEQLFRNLVFASSMAELERGAKWYVVNLRNRHIMNLKRNKPESMPVVRNVRSYLRPRYKKRFKHLTWEAIYNQAVKKNPELADLTWYMKNKSLSCGRAFNIL